MTPERWQRLEALYDEAVELPPPERERFLDEQCRDDDDLRRDTGQHVEQHGRRRVDHQVQP